jgi:serine/threonine protein kinase
VGTNLTGIFSLAGYPPFSEDEAEETGVPLKELILEKPIEFPEEEWVDISDDAKDFIRRLLERDPAKRMRAKEALMHPFVGGGRKYSIVHDDSHMAIVEQLRKQLDLEASSANSTPRDPTSPRDATGVDPLSDSESGSAASSLVRPRTGTLTAPPPSVPTPPNPKEQEASQKRAQKLKKFTAKRRFAVRYRFLTSL